MDKTKTISERHGLIDRREQPRQKVGNETTLIDLHDGRGPMRCRIWDISAAGACLLIPPSVTLPRGFKIYLDDSWQAADVIWRRDWHVGIQFVV